MVKKIGIIAAMDEELDRLHKALGQSKETVIAETSFYEGTLDGVPVVLCKSGIGKVNAGMATAVLNHVFHPDAVLNTGSAGGLESSCAIGDIVLGQDVVYHDVDATAFGYRYGQVPREPFAYPGDAMLLSAAQTASEELDVQVRLGRIATGDSFMNDSEKVAYVQSQLPELLATEMEGAAIAQVCGHFGTPVLIIRALSDVAGEESKLTHEEFLELASVNSAELVRGVLRVIASQGEN